jgi:pimeloyl-ACP methyl ester carboxylesterase
MCTGLYSHAQTKSMLDTAQDKYIKVTDVKLHYKSWGKGQPILLLHGAMEYWHEFRQQIPALAKDYRVIAIDTRGHGGSTFTDRELSYDLLATDMLDLMVQLKIDSADVIGYGDGGIIGMKMAIKEPSRVKRLVAIGSNLTPDSNAVYPEVMEKVRTWDIDKMAFYLQVKFKESPNTQMLKPLAKRMQKLLTTQPQLTRADLKGIHCPTLIMAGDKDIIKLAHTQYMYESLPTGYMSIIPGTTHYCIKEKPQIVNATIRDFLKWRGE